MDLEKFEHAITKYGTPLYVFDMDEVKRKTDYFRDRFRENAGLCFAMKANPFLTCTMSKLTDRIEVCSMGEFEICRELQIEAEKLLISGVLKKKKDITEILNIYGGRCRYTVESVEQLYSYINWSSTHGEKINVYLRLTSGNQFGMDEEAIEKIIASRDQFPMIKVCGIHFFSGTQKKTAEKFSKEIASLVKGVIPEMFNKTEITVEKIVNLVVSSIIKRKIMGIDYGVAMISEGVFHALSDEEIKKSGIHFSYDEHGHPELGKVSKAHIFNEMLENKLKELKIKVKSRPVEIGYEVRCQTPIAYDLVYCSELGMGVYKLFSEGKTGCMVYISQDGFVSPLYLKDLQDPATGKIPPRLVNIDSDKIQQVIDNLMNYITPADYEAAKAYVADPEVFDFKKILNW